MSDDTHAAGTSDFGVNERDGSVEAGIALVLRAEDHGDWKPVAEWLAQHPEAANEVNGFLAGQQKLRPVAPVVAPGSVGGMELKEEVGRGAMGIVYKAFDPVLKWEVAVKMVRTGAALSADELARFRFEAENVAKLDHRNIVRVLSFGETNGDPYLVMPLMTGGTLAQRLKDNGPLPQADAAKLVRDIALGVYHAHQRGLIHRDLKPGNILLDADGIPHVADFGLARHVDATATMGIAGTFAYMAPEQAGGQQLTTAVDVWALGAILFELLTGRTPFTGDVPSILRKLSDPNEHAPSVSKYRPDVPADLGAICAKCLERDPNRRYASAQELADDLSRYLRREPVKAQQRGLLGHALGAFEKPAEPRPYVTVASVWFALLNYPLVHIVIAGLVLAGAAPGWSFGAMMYAFATWLGMTWWFHARRLSELNAGERLALVSQVGMWIAVVTLLPLQIAFFGLNVMPYYPVLNAIGALIFFVLGGNFAGRNYAAALPIFAQNLLLPFLPPWAWPLLHALSLVALYGLFGLHLRQVNLDARRAEEAAPEP